MPQDDKPRPDIELQELGQDFDERAALNRADERSRAVFFFGRVLGRKGAEIVCEAEDGIYYFEQSDVLRIRSIEPNLDVMAIRPEAHCRIFTSLRRLARLPRGAARDVREAAEPSRGIAGGVRPSRAQGLGALWFPAHEYRSQPPSRPTTPSHEYRSQPSTPPTTPTHEYRSQPPRSRMNLEPMPGRYGVEWNPDFWDADVLHEYRSSPS
jgi:hypothetical protein